MTFALLAYRPGSVAQLRLLLRYMRREELKNQYARNTDCIILRALCPEIRRELYSEFVETLDGTRMKDTRSGEEIRQDIISKLRRRAKTHGSVHTDGKVVP